MLKTEADSNKNMNKDFKNSKIKKMKLKKMKIKNFLNLKKRNLILKIVMKIILEGMLNQMIKMRILNNLMKILVWTKMISLLKLKKNQN